MFSSYSNEIQSRILRYSFYCSHSLSNDLDKYSSHTGTNFRAKKTQQKYMKIGIHFTHNETYQQNVKTIFSSVLASSGQDGVHLMAQVHFLRSLISKYSVFLILRFNPFFCKLFLQMCTRFFFFKSVLYSARRRSFVCSSDH